MGNCQSARDLEYGDPILTVSSDANSEHKFDEHDVDKHTSQTNNSYTYLCLNCFLPCMVNKYIFLVFATIVVSSAIILLTIIGAGPINCDTTHIASVFVILVIVVILFIVYLCSITRICNGKEDTMYRFIVYCLNCFSIVLLFIFMLTSTIIVSLSSANGDPHCKLGGALIAAITLAFLFCLVTCCICVCKSLNLIEYNIRSGQ